LHLTTANEEDVLPSAQTFTNVDSFPPVEALEPQQLASANPFEECGSGSLLLTQAVDVQQIASAICLNHSNRLSMNFWSVPSGAKKSITSFV
jgi:hypothetical protein